ncbi:MAG: bifunctional hydroxymethylpyrimidine kinase/phosphomethylpyrimidine kinase [Flavobacteriales bacterium]
MKNPPITLTIAGSDSGGGAGIQADLKTFSALGCYGITVIIALTAQNTKGVHHVEDVNMNSISAQLDSVLNDFTIDAIKIGMLHSSEIIKTIFQKLKEYDHFKNIILDPVMTAESGDVLLEKNALHSLKNQLIPNALLITPNLSEAEILLNGKINDSKQAVKELCENSNAALLKGGHGNSDFSEDLLFERSWENVITLSKKRVDTKNKHGTGCTLSSAIASFIARGYNLKEAVENSKNYITNALENGKNWNLGSGNGPVHHFYDIWQK